MQCHMTLRMVLLMPVPYTVAGRYNVVHYHTFFVFDVDNSMDGAVCISATVVLACLGEPLSLLTSTTCLNESILIHDTAVGSFPDEINLGATWVIRAFGLLNVSPNDEYEAYGGRKHASRTLVF